MVDFEEETGKSNVAILRAKEQENLAQLLSEKYGLPYTDLTLVPINTDALKEVSEEEARAANIAPFRLTGKTLHIAATSPKDEKVVMELKAIEGRGFKVELYVASKNSLLTAWERYKDVAISMETSGGILEISHKKISAYLDKITSVEDATRVIKEIIESKKKYQTTELLELFIASAIATNSSDIHVEPREDSVLLRYRLDGVLHEMFAFEHSIYTLLASRIKLLSGMKLNIKDAAQDGRFSIKLRGDDVEIRSSTIPGAYGESVVLRILNPKAIKVGFEDLGLEPRLLKALEKETRKPNGMIITTGPTGSGKTTTLYAFLRKIYTAEIKVVTIEDPVEYHIEGVTQTQVDQESGYTFSEGLRSVLRQDPDVIMVGEIRDNDTASTAIHAALTGHLVLSTLHTNDAAGAIPRFVDMGINSQILGSAMNAVLAQRLVRKLCNDCKKKEPATEGERGFLETILTTFPEAYKDEVSGLDLTALWKPTGCPTCNTIGYKGRIGIFEGIFMDKDIENITKTNPSARDIRVVADTQGFLTLKQDGVLKVLRGITSLDEVKRVIGE